ARASGCRRRLWAPHERRPQRCRLRSGAGGLDRGERLLRVRDHVLGGEAELLEELLRGGRGAGALEADRAAALAEVAVPGERDARLDGDAGAHGRRDDRLTVVGVLLLEPLEAREGHDTRRDALGLENLAGRDSDLDLGARGEE